MMENLYVFMMLKTNKITLSLNNLKPFIFSQESYQVGKDLVYKM